jgi:hypothetical protein
MKGPQPMSDDKLTMAAHEIRCEAEAERREIDARYELADAFLGLDSLLRGAWGTENLNALGGGKTQVEKAWKVLGRQIEEIAR